MTERILRCLSMNRPRLLLRSGPGHGRAADLDALPAFRPERNPASLVEVGVVAEEREGAHLIESDVTSLGAHDEDSGLFKCSRAVRRAPLH
jgi:hypothetical protein